LVRVFVLFAVLQRRSLNRITIPIDPSVDNDGSWDTDEPDADKYNFYAIWMHKNMSLQLGSMRLQRKEYTHVSQ